MGLRDIAFGRKKLPEPKDDRLFALATASVTLETELGLKTAGKAAITYRPLSSGEFSRVDNDTEQLIKTAGSSAGAAGRAQDRHLRLRVADRHATPSSRTR